MSDPQKLKIYDDPILDRQIEELIASIKVANEELGLSVAEPSAISNLTATGGWGIIGLEYAYNNYNGHLYSEVWRSDDSIFSNGARVGATAAKFYNDSIYGAGLSDVYYYWVRNVNIDGDSSDWYGPVSGSISATSTFNIDDLIGQLGFTHFTAGTYPIRSEATLPDLSTTPANYPVGSLIYLTTNGKLYRNVSWAWTAEIDAGDIEGLLTNDQIDSINAAKITSQITQTQITDGAISTAKLDAGAVTTAKIAAGSVTADELAANSVTANAVKAGEITSGKLSANSVVAGNIAAGALVVDDGVMNNGYIKTALIDDGAVTNLKIGNVIESTDGVTWSIDKNGGIICRDLSILNSDGTTLLQSGGSLDFSDISGAGAFAGIDQVTAANISTYIDTAAIDTAYIADAAITNAKIDRASVNKLQVVSADIADLAVDTAQIADGAIENAKIGDAQVDTLQLAGECVVIPRSYVNAAAVTLGSSNTNYLIADSGTFTLDNAGQKILVQLSTYINANHEASAAKYTYYRVYGGATGATLSTTITVVGGNGSFSYAGYVPNMVQVTSVAGSNRIKVYAYHSGHDYAAVQKRQMLVQGVQV